jgi:alpha-amylase
VGVLLQAFFKLSPQHAVPSPADGDPSTPWWWDHLASQANDFRKSGFTALWLPPVLKTISGVMAGADGYGPFDDYDIGSKNQKGSVPTRFGTREQLQRCVATLRANGLDVYLDMVEHQRVGDVKPFVFRYLGADGTPDIGRFPKNPLNFLPQVARDPNLGGPPSDDIPFGRELAPINAKPPHYVFDNLIAAADWLTRALDVQGYRLDDVKGLSTDFLFPFLQTESMAGKFAVGEFFDGNRVLVNGWVSNPKGMQNRSSAFDFPMRFVIASMCNNAGRFNMADLDHVGLTGISPAQAVTFVENHDTDLNPSRVVFNKLLGYAYILTSEGYPCIYYRDYSTDKDCYGLKPQIDNLIWIHEKLANGPTQQRWMDFDVFAYERLNEPHLLVGLNNNPDSSRTISVATSFGSGVTLHDYTGHRGNVVTDGNGSVTINIPQNQNGLGYVCYSRDGLGGGFNVQSHPVTQMFEGAADLDILPARKGVATDVGPIWCQAGTPIQASLQPDMSNWANDTEIVAEILAPNGNRVATRTYKKDTPPKSAFSGNAPATGFHTLRVTAANTPPANPNPAYTLSAIYTAPQQFDEPVGGAPPAPAAKPEVVGKWGAVFSLPNVAIHAHVLPNRKVLFWGRRDHPTDSLNVHECTPFVWDPATKTSTQTPQPALANGAKINLFCSGHTFLPDGRLLVIGGHLADSNGLNQSCIYDPIANTWKASGLMNNGRWYPTAVTLSDGTVLASSGSFVTPDGKNPINNVQQIWQNGVWRSIVTFDTLPLFPRMHVAPDGRVFMSGNQCPDLLPRHPESGNVDTAGQWRAGKRRARLRALGDI